MIKTLKTEISAIYVIIVINFILILITTLYGGVDRIINQLKFGVLIPEAVYEGEYWRMLTTAFLHGGIFHFVVNTYSLYQIGSYVEHHYGTRKFVMVYILTALTGSLLSLIFTQAPTVGASGAIFGLIGLLLGNSWRNNTYSADLPVDSVQLMLIAGINLFLGFSISGIDNFGHIGGLIGGIILGYLIDPSQSFYTSTLKIYLTTFLELTAYLLFLYSIAAGIINFLKY